MFSVNAAFVMGMLFLTMARVPRREWLSLGIALFALGFAAMSAQPGVEAVLRGGRVSRAEAIFLGLGAMGCAYCAILAWDDAKSLVARRRRGERR